jgi:hypothetical protein
VPDASDWGPAVFFAVDGQRRDSLARARSTEKIGSGIEYWVVENNSDAWNRSRGFRIKQVDRSETVRFGYGDIINPPNRVALVKEALKNEARYITGKFRADAFEAGDVHCSRTGAILNNINDAQAVHYDPPFHELTTVFVDQHGGWDAIQLEDSKVHPGHVLASDAVRAAWLHYHADHLGGLRIERLS